MLSANDVRRGQVVKYNGTPHLILETNHRTPGNLRAFVQIKMRNLIYGKSLDQRFSSFDSMDVLMTERKKLEFSYVDRDSFAFMDPESYETIELPAELIGDAKNFLTSNGEVEVLYVDNKPLTIELPPSVVLEVTESAAGIKGDTASNVQKPATMETGLVVQVPLFIKEGEKLKISTTDGSYMSRS
ncbi:MAG: elongation factor P [Candidatus Synoicihabitans palmerolidicus]|nr:elongation factor P [Candidatus Synoicihabitans palmerolidicus]